MSEVMWFDQKSSVLFPARSLPKKVKLLFGQALSTVAAQKVEVCTNLA